MLNVHESKKGSHKSYVPLYKWLKFYSIFSPLTYYLCRVNLVTRNTRGKFGIIFLNWHIGMLVFVGMSPYGGELSTHNMLLRKLQENYKFSPFSLLARALLWIYLYTFTRDHSDMKVFATHLEQRGVFSTRQVQHFFSFIFLFWEPPQLKVVQLSGRVISLKSLKWAFCVINMKWIKLCISD